jgi:hypothetical protein
LPTWTHKLFAKFATIYGKTWTDKYHDPNSEQRTQAAIALSKKEWATVPQLAHLDWETVDCMADLCKTRLEYPPSIANFLTFLSMGKEESARRKLARGEIKALPPPPLSEEDQALVERWEKKGLVEEHMRDFNTNARDGVIAWMLKDESFRSMQGSLELAHEIQAMRGIGFKEAIAIVYREYEFNYRTLKYEAKQKPVSGDDKTKI